MAIELRKLGAAVVEGPDFIEIAPPLRWTPAAIHTYDDHRVAMCFSLAACNPLAAPSPTEPVAVRILDPKCVAKTFPDYFETLFSVAGTESRWIPVITVDGPTASGKGTVASAVAELLGYHVLDSGVLYRATALAAIRHGVGADDEQGLSTLAEALELGFEAGTIRLGGTDVTALLRDENVGALASRISALPAVRQALLRLQYSFRRLPGLVADGRDMGTVVFPDAGLKVFLTASAEARAHRRLQQLEGAGVSTTLEGLLAGLRERDARDQNRAIAPLKPAADAVLLDNSTLSIESTVEAVKGLWEQRRPFA